MGDLGSSDKKNNWNISTTELYSRPEQHEVVEWLYKKYGIWISVNKLDGFQDLFFYSIIGSNGFNRGFKIELVEWDDDLCDKFGYNNKYLNSPQEAYSAAFVYIRDNNLIKK
jgi:hypothetical protein